MNELLCDEKLTRIDEYEFKINLKEFINEDEKNKIKIIFENNKFRRCDYYFGLGAYSRNKWKVLNAIDRKIEELERRYKDEN